jgi:hypothetical protein
MNPRRFFILALTLALVLVAGTYGLAWWLQPVYGDLTRIGGHAERDFGWNQPMLEFEPLLATFGAWEHPVDVLVLGDSFANLRPRQQWQNWLAARTGWRIHTLDKHRVVIDELLAGDLFRKHPPRLVIWNNIERDLKAEYSAAEADCDHPLARVAQPLRIDPVAAMPRAVHRSSGFAEINPGFARRWMLKSIQRALVREADDSLRFALVRSDLFSNRLAGEILLYRKDLVRSDWTSNDLARIRCGYASLARRFEANGVTRFVTALAPDKSSAYQVWLARRDSLPGSRLHDLLVSFPVPDARLDVALSRAIAKGERDVYLPNDTHWGSAGHRLAAEAILAMLTAEGLTR